MQQYQGAGIDIIKIAGRDMDDSWMINAAERYAHSINSPDFYRMLIERGGWKYVALAHPEKSDLQIDIDLPNDFITWFKEGRCIHDCGLCGHCSQLARKHIRFNSTELKEEIYMAYESRYLKRQQPQICP